jgi:hypothetical protein
MTTIASHSYTAPAFGNKTQGDKPKRSPFFYRETQGKIELGRFERLLGYQKPHLRAGFNEAQQWFKGKSVIGKVIAVSMLAGTAALEFVISPLTVGVWSLGKVFFPKLNLSGLGRAFHYGVQKSYELSKNATPALDVIAK